MLPISFLRQLISMYGNSMQALMPHYLEATMDNFRANQRKLQETWSASMGPDALAKLAETNMAMFQAAASAFMPGAKRARSRGRRSSPATPSPRGADERRPRRAARSRWPRCRRSSTSWASRPVRAFAPAPRAATGAPARSLPAIS